jgi:hypothetical protein
VIVTFLGTQTAYLITKSVPHIWLLAQYVSAVLLIFAGTLTMVELCPREYFRFSPSNGALEERLPSLVLLCGVGKRGRICNGAVVR